jgi:hypothetical protein
VSKPPLGPPVSGSAAQLAAALLQLRQAAHLEQAEGDRCLIARARDPEFPTHLDRRLQEARERTNAARARVVALKESIRRDRIARGKHCIDVAKLARELFGLDDPDANAPLLPWGSRPAADERKRPVTTPQPPSYHDLLIDALNKHLDGG